MNFEFKGLKEFFAGLFTGNPEIKAEQENFAGVLAAEQQALTQNFEQMQGKISALEAEKATLETKVGELTGKLQTAQASVDTYNEIKPKYEELKAMEEQRKQALGLMGDDGGKKNEGDSVKAKMEARKAEQDELRAKYPKLMEGV